MRHEQPHYNTGDLENVHDEIAAAGRKEVEANGSGSGDGQVERARWVQLAYDLEHRAADDAAERGEVY